MGGGERRREERGGGMEEEEREWRGEEKSQGEGRRGAGRTERREGLLQNFQLTLISNSVLLDELEMDIGFALLILTFKNI